MENLHAVRQMSIKFKIVLFFCVQVLLLAILFVDLAWMLDNAHHLSSVQERRYQLRNLAEKMRQSSEDLTRMARSYAATGDQRYRQYYQAILDIRDGRAARPHNYKNIYWDFITSSHQPETVTGRPVSIESLMKELQLSPTEMAMLMSAKKKSDRLSQIEKQAFTLLQENPTGGPDNTGTKQARQLLYSTRYHQAKSSIMEDIDRFFKEVDTTTRKELQRSEAMQQQPMLFAIALSIILLGMNLIGYILFKKDITNPLNAISSWVKEMRKGRYEFAAGNFNGDEIGTLAHAFSDMATTVSQQIDELQTSSTTDPLTGVNNRLALDKVLVQEIYRFERYDSDCSLIILDIDHFKSVNDRFGHLVGDQVLLESAALLAESVRETDIVGRWGGEEFMIICPNTDLQGGGQLAELIRARFSEKKFTAADHISVSLGVAGMEKGCSAEEIIRDADNALYCAKNNGRNRVCLHQDELTCSAI